MNVPKICLNMIVKNESTIIIRLLESVTPLIDSYCICDTGSTDNTITLIKEYCKSKNITGKIIELEIVRIAAAPRKIAETNNKPRCTPCLNLSKAIIDNVIKIAAEEPSAPPNIGFNLMTMSPPSNDLPSIVAPSRLRR